MFRWPIKPKSIPKNNLDSESAKWLEGRKISPKVAEASGCVISDKNNKPVIGFSFESDGEVEAVKYRSANGTKTFWWEGNAQKLWGKQTVDKSTNNGKYHNHYRGRDGCTCYQDCF